MLEGGGNVKMTVQEARKLAGQLGYRLEKVRGEDKWIVRDLYTDFALVTSTSGKTFAETVRWLERAKRGQ